MKLVEINGKHVALLSVRDMMEIGEIAWQQDRTALIGDLETAKAPPELKVEKLREQSQQRGTAIALLYGSMRLEIARQIIERALKAGGHDTSGAVDMMTPAAIVQKAQMLLGYASEEESSTGNA